MAQSVTLCPDGAASFEEVAVQPLTLTQAVASSVASAGLGANVALYDAERGRLFAGFQVGVSQSGYYRGYALVMAPDWGRGNTTAVTLSFTTDVSTLPAGMMVANSITPPSLLRDAGFGGATFIRAIVATPDHLVLAAGNTLFLVAVEQASVLAGGTIVQTVNNVPLFGVIYAALWVPQRAEVLALGDCPVSGGARSVDCAVMATGSMRLVSIKRAPLGSGAAQPWLDPVAVLETGMAADLSSPLIALALLPPVAGSNRSRVAVQDGPSSVRVMEEQPDDSWGSLTLLAGGGSGSTADGDPAAGAALSSLGRIFTTTLPDGSPVLMLPPNRFMRMDGTLGSFSPATAAAAKPVYLQLPFAASPSGKTAVSVNMAFPMSMSVCPPAQSACPAGQRCTLLSPEPPIVGCPAGLRCGAGTIALFAPSDPSRSSILNASACPSGHMCPQANQSLGVSIPCAAGSACVANSSTAGEPALISYAVLPCPGGYYCPQATAPQPCAPGTRCPGGSINADGSPTGGTCPAGSMCDDAGGASPCRAGSYCPSGTVTRCFGGGSQCTNTPKLCAPGVRCPAETQRADGFPSGGVCPPGSACFTNGTTLSCPAGHYCRNGTDASCAAVAPDAVGCGPVACRPGMRCPGGSAFPDGLPTGGICPAGSACFTTSNETFPCPPTKFCPAGSVRCPVSEGKSECNNGPPKCAMGVRCPGGAATADGLPTGGICPAGSTCDTDGRTLPCPPGSWCPAGTSNEGEPMPVRCRPGILCIGGAADELGGPTPANGGLAPAGFYSVEGSSVPSGSCAPGYYCPEGSFTGASPVTSGCWAAGLLVWPSMKRSVAEFWLQ